MRLSRIDLGEMAAAVIVAAMLSIVLSVAARSAPCDNCHGDRVVGPGPVRFICPLCDGAGEVIVPEPQPEAADSANTSAERSERSANWHRAAICRVRSGTGPEIHCGSGVLIRREDGRGTVLTNWHVIKHDRVAVRVVWPDGTESRARVTAEDRHWDLASLDVQAPAAEPVPLAQASPEIGDRLTIAGYGPPPYSYREAAGGVVRFWRPTRTHPHYIAEVAVTPRQGDSGGPILNGRGQVVALLHGGADGMTMGSDVRAIRQFLGAGYSAECADERCAKR